MQLIRSTSGRPDVEHDVDRAGRLPRSWAEMVGVNLPRDVPLDPTRRPFAVDFDNGTMNVSPGSECLTLPGEKLPPLPQ